MGRPRKYGEVACRHCGAMFRKREANHFYCSRQCGIRGYWRERASTPYSRYYINLIKKA